MMRSEVARCHSRHLLFTCISPVSASRVSAACARRCQSRISSPLKKLNVRNFLVGSGKIRWLIVLGYRVTKRHTCNYIALTNFPVEWHNFNHFSVLTVSCPNIYLIIPKWQTKIGFFDAMGRYITNFYLLWLFCSVCWIIHMTPNKQVDIVNRASGTVERHKFEAL
jgi:hypothetical protein